MNKLKKQAKLEKEKLEVLREGIRKAEKKFYRQHKKWTRTIEEIDRLKLKEKMDWKYLLTALPETTLRYNRCQEELQKIGLTSSGYYSSTNQTCVQIALYKFNDKKNRIATKGLKKLLPYIKPLEGTIKRVSIFEHTLAEGGSYRLEIKGNRARVVKCTFGRDNVEFGYKQLDKVLEYIKNHLWYEEN